MSKNMKDKFESGVMINGGVPENKENYVFKDSFISAWGKTQHIKLDYNMENTQMTEDGMAEANKTRNQYEEIQENQTANGKQGVNRMQGDSKSIMKLKNSIMCDNNKFQVLMEEQEEGEIIEVAEIKELNLVENAIEYVTILVKQSNSEQCLNSGDQTANSEKIKLSKEVRSLGPVDATHRKRKGHSKADKKAGDFSPLDH
ncbi:hypothetical protein MA16_Dca018307 [Dendrobium catenatum]|uniref:Uncharacterized protein n=1 Tax=Dendrobium catenatum TaxID=906689 RepID=A0A2I0WJH8_9ASPA|nr:hypothetical protein MA16_Dca018307 [Dendrobium catenatum]